MGRKLIKALGHLAIALINATLILVIVAALSLGYLVNAVNEATQDGAARVAEAAVAATGIEPGALREEVAQLRETVAGLRTDLANREGPGEAAALQRIEDELQEIATLLRGLGEPTVTVTPGTVEAVNAALSSLLARLMALRDGDPSRSTVPPSP